jgi:hypothetical protein
MYHGRRVDHNLGGRLARIAVVRPELQLSGTSDVFL